MLGCEGISISVRISILLELRDFRGRICYKNSLDILGHLGFHPSNPAHVRKSHKLNGSSNEFL
jgi:hypothetical protein